MTPAPLETIRCRNCGEPIHLSQARAGSSSFLAFMVPESEYWIHESGSPHCGPHRNVAENDYAQP